MTPSHTFHPSWVLAMVTVYTASQPDTSETLVPTSYRGACLSRKLDSRSEEKNHLANLGIWTSLA